MIPLFKMYNDKQDAKAVLDIVKRGSFWACGPEIEELENKTAKYIGTKYAVACNSGTSALHACMILLNIGPGDEVIVPSFTFIATANCVLMTGAKPVFADIEKDSFGLDPQDVLNKITDKTKAIIAVHYGGTPCKIKELRKIADDYGLFLIEDACEAFGATIGKKKVGTFGHLGVFSLCQNKIITTGEGGFIVFNIREWNEPLKLIRSHGKQGNDFVCLGYNWRMPTILASLGLSQLKKVDFLINKRRENAFYLAEKLSTNVSDYKNTRNVFQLFSIVLDPEYNRDFFVKELAKSGIQSGIYFNPIHKTSFYKSLGYKDELPVTESVSKQILTLPNYPDLNRKEMDFICEKIWKIIST